MKRKGNNNYWSNQYSHKYARQHFSRKAPANLKDIVLAEIMNLAAKNEYSFVTIEAVSKGINVLHKHVHGVFMELQKQGVITQRRNVNRSSISRSFKKDVLYHQLPVHYINDAMHDGARHAKMYTLSDKQKLLLFPQKQAVAIG